MNVRKRDGKVFMLAALLGMAGITFMTGCSDDKDKEKKKDPPPATQPAN